MGSQAKIAESEMEEFSMKKRVCSLVALLAIVIMGFVRGIVKGNGMIRKRRTWQLKKKKRYMKRIICLLLVTFAVFTGFSVETLAYYAVTADDAVNWVLGHTEGKGYDYDGVYGAQCVDLIKLAARWLPTYPKI